MGIADQIIRAGNNKAKEEKMKKRKKRQKQKLRKARKKGNDKAVAKYKAKIDKTNKKRKKASKEFGRGVGQATKSAGEVALQGALSKVGGGVASAGLKSAGVNFV